MVGQKVDRYGLVKELGRGAMGVVYLARHDVTGRDVALKLLHPDKAGAPGSGAEAAVERFQREARAMGAVSTSDNVVSVLDARVDPASGAPFLVMELLNGEDLEALSSRLGPLPVELALRIVVQALRGLEPAHDAGIVHRDLKPSNLFLMKRPEGERVVKVLDFGIAKLREGTQAPGAAQLTAEGTAVGSPAYMSPEQVQASKALDVRSDVWSMGVVLYQLVSGKLPFAEAESLRDLLMAIVLSRPQPVSQRAPWVPPAVQAIIDRATQHDPAARFANAREMREAVVRLLGGAGTAITEAMLAPVPPEARSSHAPVSGMAVSMPGAASAVGGATAPMTALPAATVAGPSQASGTVSLQGAAVAAGAATAAGGGAAAGGGMGAGAGAMGAPGAAAPFAFPTQPSAGVVKPAGRGVPVVWIAAGLVLATGIGVGAVRLLSVSAGPAASATTSEPAPTAPSDAGSEAEAGPSPPVLPEPKRGDVADAGTPALPPASSAVAPSTAKAQVSPPVKPTARPNTGTPPKVKTID